jgi:predicted DNA binding CopG/RHH family protein
MKKQLKRIPKFKSEEEERKFWQRVDSTEYVDYSRMENWRFPNLKLSSKPVTLRLPISLINRLKIKAHRMDIPYQSLVKQLLFKEFAPA